MEKVLTLGNSIVFAIIALYEQTVNWLNAESKFYTDLVNEGEDEKVSITRLDAIRYNAYIILGILFIGFIGSLENMIQGYENDNNTGRKAERRSHVEGI